LTKSTEVNSTLNIVDANWENDALDCTSSGTVVGQLYWRDRSLLPEVLICPANLLPDPGLGDDVVNL